MALKLLETKLYRERKKGASIKDELQDQLKILSQSAIKLNKRLDLYSTPFDHLNIYAARNWAKNKGEKIQKWIKIYEKAYQIKKDILILEGRRAGRYKEIKRIDIKILNRTCNISFKLNESLKKKSMDEPQIVKVEIDSIDDSNIKIPKPYDSSIDEQLIYKIENWEKHDIATKRLKRKQAKSEKKIQEAIRKRDAQKRAIIDTFYDYDFYIYKTNLYCFDDSDIHTSKEQKLLIKQHYFKHEKKFAKLKKEIKLLEKLESMGVQKSREPIPEDVRFTVWRRDEGKCVKCGSNKNIEFDHIIPVSKGGSSTERNIQILCEKCNREKSDKI